MGLPESLVKGTETHGERVSSRFSRGKKVKKNYSTLTERAYRRRRSYVLLRSMIALLIVILALLAGLLIYETRKMKTYSNPYAKALEEKQAAAAKEDSSAGSDSDLEGVKAQANLLATQYDYDGAVNLLKSQKDFGKNDQLKALANSYEKTKSSCQPYPIDQITHVFFHSLVVNDAKAFDSDATAAGYNQVMTTISEFNGIIQQMYDKGYVMVSLHDMCEVAADGTVSKKEILLPPGKKPFVLSQDDCSYYHYMKEDGFPQKLVVTEDGKVRNSLIQDDGTVSIGDYDVVPLIDTFVEQHPDFSYHGHKGILALTGYEGVLGYRTDEVYKTRDPARVTEYQQKFFDENPDFDYDKDCADAKAVADAMKAEGWEFASHTWGHIAPLQYSLDAVKQDTERWLNNVAPIVGDTDVLIFAFGADIGDWHPYTHDNAYFDYLKSKKFSIYCNVDGSVKSWVQFGPDYMRQARRNLDGYRMYYNPDLLSDLFDVKSVWDSNRPTPVPKMG